MFTLLSIAILLIAILAWPIALGGPPYVVTPTATIRQALRLAQLQPGETVCDLGCGDGRALRLAAREFDAQGVGVEINPLLVLWARWRSHGLPVTVQRKRFEQADLSQVDVVYLFLIPGAMGCVAQLLRGLKPGARVVSYGFVLPGWEITAEDGGCFLYRKRGLVECFTQKGNNNGIV